MAILGKNRKEKNEKLCFRSKFQINLLKIDQKLKCD